MRNYIEEDLENSMPCTCDCGNIFDLDEGYSLPNSNKVVCEECYEKAERIQELEEEIKDLELLIDNAEFDIMENKPRLNALKTTLKELL